MARPSQNTKLIAAGLILGLASTIACGPGTESSSHDDDTGADGSIGPGTSSSCGDSVPEKLRNGTWQVTFGEATENGILTHSPAPNSDDFTVSDEDPYETNIATIFGLWPYADSSGTQRTWNSDGSYRWVGGTSGGSSAPTECPCAENFSTSNDWEWYGTVRNDCEFSLTFSLSVNYVQSGTCTEAEWLECINEVWGAPFSFGDLESATGSYVVPGNAAWVDSDPL